MQKRKIWNEGILDFKGEDYPQMRDSISLEEHHRFWALLGMHHMMLKQGQPFLNVITRIGWS